MRRSRAPAPAATAGTSRISRGIPLRYAGADGKRFIQEYGISGTLVLECSDCYTPELHPKPGKVRLRFESTAGKPVKSNLDQGVEIVLKGKKDAEVQAEVTKLPRLLID